MNVMYCNAGSEWRVRAFTSFKQPRPKMIMFRAGMTMIEWCVWVLLPKSRRDRWRMCSAEKTRRVQ